MVSVSFILRIILYVHHLSFRYIDDIFMTTNETLDTIRIRIKRAAQKYVNIKINYFIDSSVNFLDVAIMNDHGQLKMTVYHKPAAEHFVLPYQSEHPRHIHVNIPYAAVLRAARICSDLEDFNAELVRIDLTLLLNGYPPHFIDKQFRRLLGPYKEALTVKPIDQQTYGTFHRKLLNQPTRHETRSKRTTTDPAQNPSVLEMKVWDSKVMYPRYLYDSSSYHMFKKSVLYMVESQLRSTRLNPPRCQSLTRCRYTTHLRDISHPQETRPSLTAENELNCHHIFFLIKIIRKDTKTTCKPILGFH